MSINKVILVGRVGKEVQIRSLNNGNEVASFSLATSQTWKDSKTREKKEKTEWHKIVIFSQGLVSVVKQYVKKGNKLYIEGSLQTRKWTDKQGTDKYSTEIILQGFNSTLQMLGSNDTKKGQMDTPTSRETRVEQEKVKIRDEGVEKFDDKIPF